MRIDVNIPKSWEEVSGEELTKLAGLLLRYGAEEDFLVRCFLFFSGWKVMKRKVFNQDGKTWYWFRQKKGDPFAVDAQIFQSLVKSLDWIKSGVGLTASMPPLKGYQSCNVKLYNVTLDEFLNASNYFDAYMQTEKELYLDNLVAVFYRKPGEKWNPDALEKHSRRFRRKPKAFKQAVFMWFSGAKSFLVTKYPYIFSGKASANVSPEETILNLLSALNQGDVTHNQKIFNTHVHECFHELNLKAEHAEKLKK